LELIEIRATLTELSMERPTFYSENDFQHALAWKIHEKNPNMDIRLEKRVDRNIAEYFDILLIIHNWNVILELKYKTDTFQTTFAGEDIRL